MTGLPSRAIFRPVLVCVWMVGVFSEIAGSMRFVEKPDEVREDGERPTSDF